MRHPNSLAAWRFGTSLRCRPAKLWLHARRITFALATITMLVSVGPCKAQSDTPTDALFPVEVSAWKQDRQRLVRGIEQAEALRRRLLGRDVQGESPAERICRAAARFQKEGDAALSDGHGIGRFSMTPKRLVEQLRGTSSLPASAFNAFDGRWFGRWDRLIVNHDWHPTQRFDPPKRFAADHAAVSALQYAWISNGFGWNMLMAADGSGGKHYVLGMVYYFEAPNFRDVTGEKAHVGFLDSPTRLVWITEREVFFEEVFPAESDGRERYAITAMYHDLLSAEPSVSEHAIQAVYTRDPEHRPAFRKFRWSAR